MLAEQDVVGRPGRIKVMHVTHDLHIGGLQRVVVDLATRLDPARYAASVCSLRDGGPLEEELQSAGIQVFHLPRTPGRTDYFSFWKLSRVLRQSRPDILHTHNTQPLLDGAVAAKLAGIPVVIHTDHARLYPDKRRYMLAERILSRCVEQVVAVSESTKEDLVRYERIDPARIRVIPNGIAPGRVLSVDERVGKRRELDLGDACGPILGLGVRLSEQKGITFLLQAMREVATEFPHVVLLLAGEGPLEKPLRVAAESLGLAARVRFLGPRLDMREILQILDLYVLPSVWEGLPLVLLEAMWAGLPLVVTNVGGTSQAVIDGVNGFLVKSRDPMALAAAICSVLGNERLREDFGKASSRLYQERFAVGMMVQAYEELYQTCLGSAVGVLRS